MRDALEVILLGIIEGITEFLPISSTGHLLLAEKWQGSQPEYFTVFIQSGAVLAVLAVFRDRVRELLQNWRQTEPGEAGDYLKKLCFSFVLTSIGGLTMKALGWELPDETAPIAWALVIGGVMFIAFEMHQRKKRETDSETIEAEEALQITWTLAAAFAAAQLVAMAFPGASRSGATILIGVLLGMSRRGAVEFSFLLGVPTLLAAGGYQLASALNDDAAAVGANAGMLALGTVVSAVTAFLAVRWLLGYLERNTFMVFGWYRIAIGIAVLLLGGKAMAG